MRRGPPSRQPSRRRGRGPVIPIRPMRSERTQPSSSLLHPPRKSAYSSFGTPLYTSAGDPYDPSHLKKSNQSGHVPVWQQKATDEKGRRRFHGAFTGGWSAGYFNTVGSEEGWRPQRWSSRNKKQQHPESDTPSVPGGGASATSTPVSQSIYDFMDEEDMDQIMGENKLVASGVLSVDDRSVSSLGERLLKMSGWRKGDGVGEVQRIRGARGRGEKILPEGSYGPWMPGRKTDAQQEEEEEEGEVNVTVNVESQSVREGEGGDGEFVFVKRDIAQIEIPVKNDRFGLGYDANALRRIGGTAIRSIEQSSLFAGLVGSVRSPNAQRNRQSRRTSAGAGVAFGVSVLEDDDDVEVYDDVDDADRYDHEIGSVRPSKDSTTKNGRVDEDGDAEMTSQSQSQSQSRLDLGQGGPSRFVPERNTGGGGATNQRILYPPPASFLEMSAVTEDDLRAPMASLPQQGMGSTRLRSNELNPTARRRLLGEPELQVREEMRGVKRAKPNLPHPAASIPAPPPSGDADAGLGSGFFTTSHARDLQQRFREMLASRFVSGASDGPQAIASFPGQKIGVSSMKRALALQDAEAERKRREDSTRDSESNDVVMADGPKPVTVRRTVQEWHPAPLVCRRFFVMNPFPDSSLVGTVGPRGENLSFLTDDAFAGPQHDELSELERELQELIDANTTVPEEDVVVPDARPGMDLFRSIFGDESSGGTKDDSPMQVGTQDDEAAPTTSSLMDSIFLQQAVDPPVDDPDVKMVEDQNPFSVFSDLLPIPAPKATANARVYPAARKLDEEKEAPRIRRRKRRRTRKRKRPSGKAQTEGEPSAKRVKLSSSKKNVGE